MSRVREVEGTEWRYERNRREAIVIEASAPVMEPSRSSLLLAESIRSTAGDSILDLGCGSGFLGVLAAREGARIVTMSDVSQAAALQANRNAIRNRVEGSALAIVSDMVEAFGDKVFDLVVFNPPAFPSEHPERLAPFLRGGEYGRDFIERAISEVPRCLRKRGRLLLIHSSLTDLPLTQRMLKQARASAAIVGSGEAVFREEYLPDMAHLETLKQQGRAHYWQKNGSWVHAIYVLEVTW